MNPKTLKEVRENIDKIDEEIVKLIAMRANFVDLAVKFKKTKSDVPAPKRVEDVIKKVRVLADKNNVSPDIVESTYKAMIDNFINYGLKKLPGNSKK